MPCDENVLFLIFNLFYLHTEVGFRNCGPCIFKEKRRLGMFIFLSPVYVCTACPLCTVFNIIVTYLNVLLSLCTFWWLKYSAFFWIITPFYLFLWLGSFGFLIYSHVAHGAPLGYMGNCTYFPHLIYSLKINYNCIMHFIFYNLDFKFICVILLKNVNWIVHQFLFALKF